MKRAELSDFRFHDTRHTWASWHRQAGTLADELKDLGGWKSRVMVARYAKFGTEHLSAACFANRVRQAEHGRRQSFELRLRYRGKNEEGLAHCQAFELKWLPEWSETGHWFVKVPTAG